MSIVQSDEICAHLYLKYLLNHRCLLAKQVEFSQAAAIGLEPELTNMTHEPSAGATRVMTLRLF